MAARLDSVARYICRKADWDITNLQLQKLLYLSQMFHMGRNNGEPLMDAKFEAWDYGPVEPSLYHRVKIFGSGNISDVFTEARRFGDDDPRRDLLDEVCNKFLEFSAGELVDITHWDEGAWAKHYVPRAKHIRIPDADIWREYRQRQRAAQ